MQFTTESVLALAPDSSSAQAARGLLALGKWNNSLGRNDRGVWGLCAGSGSKPYQTQVDISGAALSFKCSCPSRKHPCKHGLALLLLLVQQSGHFTQPEPAWVTEWHEGRKERALKKEQKAAAIADDPAAAAAAQASAAKREDARWSFIEAGVLELERFLADHLHRGLASLGSEHLQSWQIMAKRMVDAQAPSLGDRVREASTFIGQGADWPREMLKRMGRMQLVIEAVKRRADLTPEMVGDLRAALGYAVKKESVQASGEQVEDVWMVVGSVTRLRDDGLTERRVWLYGSKTQRRALLLDYSHNNQGFPQSWTVGQACQMTLAYFPSSEGVRAVCVSAQAAGTPVAFPGFSAVEEWRLMAEKVAVNPWRPQILMLLKDVVPVREDNRWKVAFEMDGKPRAVPMDLPEDRAWDLLAIGAGLPLRLSAEWDGERLTPLVALSPEGFVDFNMQKAGA